LRDTQYKYDTNITRICQMPTSPVAREVCTMQEPICTMLFHLQLKSETII